MHTRHNQSLFWLTLILLLAAFVRINGINAQSFWIDEGFTWNLTQYGDLFGILSRDVHPPLYFILIDWWVDFAGTSTLSMRYFSLLASMLSVSVVYQFAREIETQRGEQHSFVPLIAAAMMAIAEAETFLSQEARSYTLHVFFVSLSMWGFLRWHRQAKIKHLVIWILSTIALIYTFYLGAFIGVAQGVYALLFLRRKKLVMAIGALMICAISLLPWLALTIGQQAENISAAEIITRADYGFWLNAFREQYFTGQWALMIALFIGGIVIIKNKRIGLDQTGILLILWFGVPLILTLILNERVPTYQPRRVSQIVPAIALLTALGIGHLGGRLRWILLAVILIYGTVSVDFWRYKQPWREMVTDTLSLIADDTPMLFELGGDDYAPRYHYGNALDNSFDFLLDEGEVPDNANVLFGLTTWRNLQPDIYEGNLPAIINTVNHWWLFYWSSDTGALNWLNTFGFERTATITVDFNPDVYLYRYDRLPEEAIAIYENGLILRDAIIHDDLTIDLLWSSEQRLEIDYTTSAFLLDSEGQLVAQSDSQAAGSLPGVLEARPMTGWQIGEVIYDPKPLQASLTLSPDTYSIGVVVYSVVDGEMVRLRTIAGDDMVSIGDINRHND